MLQNINDWFRSLNLKNKLAVLVILMTTFLILVGIIGLQASYKENKRLVDLYQNRLLSSKLLQGIRVNTRANEANVYKLALFPETQNQILNDINVRTKEWQTQLEEYSRTNLDSYEKAQLHIIRQDTYKYLSERSVSIRLILGGKVTEGINNYQLLLPILNDINKRLMNLAGYNTKMAKSDYENSLKQTRLNYLFILGSILLAIPLAISLLMLISSTITKPIMTLVDKMKLVASGKLDVEPAECKYKNEIGDLNQSFNVMTDKLRYLIAKERTTSEREKFLRLIVLTSITTLQTNKVLKTVVIETGKRFNAARCYFIRYDDKTNSFLPIQDYELYISSLEHKDLTGRTIVQEELEPFLKILLGQKQELIVSDVSKLSLPDKSKQFFKNYEIKSFIAAPVFFQNTPIGILFVDFNNTERKLTNEDAELLAVIANQSAVVVNQTRLFQEVQTARDRESLLRKTTDTIRSSFNTNEIKKNLVNEVGNAFKADRCIIQEYDPIKNMFLSVDEESEYLPYRDIPSFVRKEIGVKEQEYYRHFLKEPKAEVYFSNIDEYSKQLGIQAVYTEDVFRKFKIVSAFIIPIIYLDQLLGIFAIHYSAPKNLTDDEKKFIKTIVNQASVGIYQAKLYDTANKIADREATLRKIISTVRSTLDIESIEQSIVNAVGRSFNADRCFFRIYDKEHDKFLPVKTEYVSSPDVPSIIGAIFTEAKYGGFKKRYKRGELHVMYDLESCLNEPNCDRVGIQALMDDYNVKSNYGISIFYENQFFGVFVLHYTKIKVHLDNDSIETLKAVADQAGIALNQAQLYQSATVNAQRETLLRKVNESIRSTLDINDLKNRIVTEIGKALKADRCAIVEYNIENQRFSVIDENSQYVSTTGIESHIGLNIEEGELRVFRDWFLSGKELYIPDVDNPSESADPAIIKFFKNYGIKSNYTALITYHGELFGVLYLNYIKQKREFSQDDLDFFKTLSNQSSTAIYQARLYDTSQKNEKREETLRKVISTVRGTLDINETLRVIAEEVIKLFDAERVIILHYPDPENHSLWTLECDYINSSNMIPSENAPLKPEAGIYWGDFILNKGQILSIDNVKESNISEPLKYNCEILGIRAITGIPIRKGNEIWGTLSIAMNSPRHWTEDELSLLLPISDQIYSAINQAQLYSTTKENAEREALLRAINNQILASQNFQEATNAIVGEIGKIYNVDRVVLRFYEPASRSFSEVKGEYRKNELIPSALDENPYSREINEYFINEIDDKKQIIPIENIDYAEIPEALRIYFKNLKIKSTLISPILYGNTILGLIFLTNTESFKTWNQRDIELFQDITTQISIGIHMFNLTNKLSKSLESERAVREIIFETRELENHDLVFNYMLKRLLEIFHVKRSIHLHYDEYRNLTVANEALTDQEFESLYNQPLLLAVHTRELEPKSFGEVVLVTDVNSEIQDISLKDFLKNKNILAFMIYPIAKRVTKEGQEIIATTMLCSFVPRIWTQSEVDNFKLIVDATSLVYLELSQRREIEETRNTFLATLTHDLRSPLNAEQKALEAIISKRLGTSLEGFSEYLEDMYTTNQELLRIVNNILSVYHYEEGKFELKLEEINIAELIETSISVMRPLAKDQDSSINMNINPEIPPVMIDRDEVLRVINNLISNAIKHNKKGTDITVLAKRINQEIQVSVQDNGKGIPKEEKNNIFQRYPTTKRTIGTGLGLYLSKQIIDAHKGKIWFESEVGKGTTFYFTLPIA